MEVYYKDLISEENTLEKLVDDLMLVVQGAEEFAQAAGASLPTHARQEITSRLAKLKDGCLRIKRRTVETAQAADKTLREYPYSAVGFGFAFGLLLGALLVKRR
jgi:ElaB/YqjD/DUF883 family membrane-anchored ribosome-binding protein